jgi:hypothetical protein
MKTFASKEKRLAPAARKARPYVHHPIGPVQLAQREDIRRILRYTGAQAKLTIGRPNDKYEQEADHVADQVMTMPDPTLQRQIEPEEEEEALQAKPLADQITPLVQRQEDLPEEEEEEPIQAKFKDGEMIQHMYTECDEETAQRQPMEEEEEELQTKSRTDKTPAFTPSLESRINSVKGGGQPLDIATRTFFEPRFGRDFGRVRLHTDSRSAETAKSVNSKAFTIGKNVVFGLGQYSPNTSQGKRLMAHELIHVVQQNVGQSLSLQRFVACEGAEQCPPRARGESRRSRSTPHQVNIYQPTTFGILISNFAINEKGVKPDLASNPVWITFIRDMPSTAHGRWEILGFSDCRGTEARNRALRFERATEIFSILPSTASAQVSSSSVYAANLADCISSNLSESGRSRNRSVLVRRLPGSRGPTAPTGATPIGPVRPPGSPADFCTPYTNRADVVLARTFLLNVWLPLVGGKFGTHVHNLWRDYLNRPKGASLAPRVFRGTTNPIVAAFRTDPDTAHHQRLLYRDIRAAAVRTPEANVPFSGVSYMSPPIPLGTLLPATSLSRTIDYLKPRERIPGNIAGGASRRGASSSDAGPDLRLFTGTVRILRRRPGSGLPEVRRAHIEVQLQVIDAVDFCPGAAGSSWLAHRFTIPMSRLEATPWALTYDLPFHVFVDLSGSVWLP